MKGRRFTVYRSEHSSEEEALASTEASDCFAAIFNVLGPAKVWKIEGTCRRYLSRLAHSVEYVVVRLPTDDDDCAAWVMDENRDVWFISSKELATMPEVVTDTINIGCLAVEDGLMISSNLDQLFKEP